MRRAALLLLLMLAVLGAGSGRAGRGNSGRPKSRAVVRPASEVSRAAYDGPLQPPRPVSSSFGEYRRNHFHGGIDYSTDGRVGLPVHAVADGWVWRVRASGVGYGRSLYLRLADGRTAVYAHLDRFAPTIQAFVEAAQESLGQYEVDLRPAAARLSFRRGEVVAWSGESGAGPPHLHFEMRDGEAASIGLNPRRIGFADADTSRPLIRRLLAAPVGPGSRVDGQLDRVAIEVVPGGPGRGRLARPLRATGAVRFSIEAWDPAPRGNRLAISRARLSRGGRPLYGISLERFSWDRAHDVERFYDEHEAELGRSFVVHLYRPDGPASPLFGPGDGVVARRPAAAPGGADVESLDVLVEDAAGRSSRLTWRLEWSDGAGGAAPVPVTLPFGAEGPPGPALGLVSRVVPDGMILAVTGPAAGAESLLVIPDVPARGPSPWWERLLGRPRIDTAPAWPLEPLADGSRGTLAPPPARFLVRPAVMTRVGGVDRVPAVFLDTLEVVGIVRGAARTLRVGDFSMALPESAAFGPAWIGLSSAPAPALVGLAAVSPVQRLEAPGLVFDRAVRLALTPPRGADTTRVGLYARGADGEWDWVGAGRGGDGIGGDTRYPGDLCLFRDVEPPTIAIAEPAAGAASTSERPAIRVTLADVGSGFGWRQIETTLDDVRQIVVWDPESASLTGRSRRPLAPGEHTLTVRVRDRAGNVSEARRAFRVIAR